MKPRALDDLDDKTREQLLEFRSQIDAFDDQIIDLLIRRSQVVKQVGALKKRSHNPTCYIRPAREADMLRDITARFHSGGFPPAAAAALWRIIIAGSTSIESAFAFSVLENRDSSALYWLTREYFGGFSAITRQNHAKLVLSDLMEDKANVGILPMPSTDPDGNWWQLLLENTAPAIQVFACLPFVLTSHDRFKSPPAVALAKLHTEPTGNDRTLLALDADEGISQHRLSSFFAEQDLPAEWIDLTPPQAGRRLHLLSIKRFLAPGDALIAALTSGDAFSDIRPVILGSYAAPLYLDLLNHDR